MRGARSLLGELVVGEGVLAQVHFLALLDELPILAVAVNTTFEEEFRPVSQES